jgi:hypothetical protein
LGAQSVDSIIISINNTPPAVDITSPVNNSLYNPNNTDTVYTLAANVTDTEHSPGQLKYEWQTILRHNNHQHTEPIDTNKNTTSHISRVGCNGDTYFWQFMLKVTDAAGLWAIDSAQILPNCAGQGPLPLFLKKFSVLQQGNTNLVQWTTAQELDLVYFEVERSTNGIIFNPINRQTATNLPDEKNYSYPDNSFSPGTNYYRLKILELDGHVRYSIVIKVVSGNNGAGFSIAPNPGRDNFAVIFHSDTGGPVSIIVRDLQGRVVQRINQSANNGQNVVYISDFEKQSAGIYFVTVHHGDKIMFGKYIKSR